MVPGRRRFLTMIGATVATGAMHAGCSGDDPAPPERPKAGSNVRDVPVGTLGVVRAGVLLGRDAGGLYAMTAICTHNQCDLTVYGTFDASGISCGCHGSRYSTNGAAIKGPAIDALKHLKVTVAPDGSITVDSAAVVDASARTAV